MSPRADVPPRRLPIVYFALGHLALLAALAVPALDPGSIAGFFYHPRMFVVVHLVTLGWITLSIFGATYVVGPIALRAAVPGRAVDGVACALAAIGVAGIVAHFWDARYRGIVYSAGLLFLGAAAVFRRVLGAMRAGKSPLAVRAHVALAYGNLLLAIASGMALAWNKEHPFLPRGPIASAFGHAHLAAVGWATLMVVGVGYRLFPMFLPAKPPSGPSLVATPVLLEAGALGLFASSFFGFPPTVSAAPLAAAGVFLFVFEIARAMRRRVPAPPALRRPDFGMLHALQALLYLLVTAGIGLRLAFSPALELDWVMLYGVFGLLGFLGQIVIGMGMRLLPMFAWAEAYAASGYETPPPSPHSMPARPLQATAFVLWTAGVPLFGCGLFTGALGVVSAGAWTLFLGTLAASLSSLRVARHAFRRA